MIPDIKEKKWKKLISEGVKYNFKSLAFKLLLTDLQRKNKDAPENVDNHVKELYDFCVKHKNNREVMSDVECIFENV